MKNKLFALAWSALLILAAWIAAGPFVASYQIRTAVQQRDAQSLGDHVDFPAVRDSLNDQVATLFGGSSSDGTQDSGGGFANFARVLVGSALQVMVTPQGVLELLRRRTALADGAPQTSGGTPDSAPSPSDGAPKLKPVIPKCRSRWCCAATASSGSWRRSSFPGAASSTN
jgi:hypothetical protein